MAFLDRRDLFAGVAALLGAELVAPLAKALAAEMPMAKVAIPIRRSRRSVTDHRRKSAPRTDRTTLITMHVTIGK